MDPHPITSLVTAPLYVKGIEHKNWETINGCGLLLIGIKSRAGTNSGEIKISGAGAIVT